MCIKRFFNRSNTHNPISAHTRERGELIKIIFIFTRSFQFNAAMNLSNVSTKWKKKSYERFFFWYHERVRHTQKITSRFFFHIPVKLHFTPFNIHTHTDFSGFGVSSKLSARHETSMGKTRRMRVKERERNYAKFSYPKISPIVIKI